MSKKIVIVDDDVKIAELSGQSLESKSYIVEVFSEPLKALDFILNNRDYRILITDNIMPELNGTELIEKVIEGRQDVCFILATGDDTNIKKLDLDQSIYKVISKPFRRKNLIEAIEGFNV